MGRKPRIEYKGAIYHVIQRGNNKEYVFKKDEHKKYLLTKLNEIKNLMGFEVYGFVLMDNHYHFIIKCYECGISTIMHRINCNYGKYYNALYYRTGHVFQDRYSGLLVRNEGYLFSLLRYIHQNPVKANMCKKVSDYRWSSDYFYRNNKCRSIVQIDAILNAFSSDRRAAIKEYIKFMDAPGMEESTKFEDTDAIGEKEENEETVDTADTDENEVTVDTAGQEKDAVIPSLDDILNLVTENNKKIIDNIKGGSRARDLTQYKKIYVETALTLNYTMKDIGENIGITKTAVMKLSKNQQPNLKAN